MTKLIPLDAAITAVNLAIWKSPIKARISTIDASNDTAEALRTIPTIDPAAIREVALREAAAVVASCTWSEYWIYDGDYVEPLHLSDCILALIKGEKK